MADPNKDLKSRIIALESQAQARVEAELKALGAKAETVELSAASKVVAFITAHPWTIAVAVLVAGYVLVKAL